MWTHVPRNIAEYQHCLDCALATTAYAARASLHATLGASPGSIAFNRDMLLDIPVIADLQLLKDKRQRIIEKNLLVANKARVSHDYQPGEQVLKLVYKPNKLEPRSVGPYTIERVHTNGNVTIRTHPNMTERINVRRIKPYQS
jgi:hypothetical protein